MQGSGRCRIQQSAVMDCADMGSVVGEVWRELGVG